LLCVPTDVCRIVSEYSQLPTLLIPFATCFVQRVIAYADMETAAKWDSEEEDSESESESESEAGGSHGQSPNATMNQGDAAAASSSSSSAAVHPAPSSPSFSLGLLRRVSRRFHLDKQNARRILEHGREWLTVSGIGIGVRTASLTGAVAGAGAGDGDEANMETGQSSGSDASTDSSTSSNKKRKDMSGQPITSNNANDTSDSKSLLPDSRYILARELLHSFTEDNVKCCRAALQHVLDRYNVSVDALSRSGVLPILTWLHPSDVSVKCYRCGNCSERWNSKQIEDYPKTHKIGDAEDESWDGVDLFKLSGCKSCGHNWLCPKCGFDAEWRDQHGHVPRLGFDPDDDSFHECCECSTRMCKDCGKSCNYCNEIYCDDHNTIRDRPRIDRVMCDNCAESVR